MHSSDLAKAQDIAKDLALTAGQIIKNNLTLGIKRDWKSDLTPVTQTDRDVNALVIKAITKEYPSHSILSEEGSHANQDSTYTWVCDPIDGTFPFIHGIPISTFSLALVDQSGQAIVAVIYDPFLGRLYTATKGNGCYLNEERINTSRSTTLKKTSVGLVYWIDNKDVMLPLIGRLIDAGVNTFEAKSIAYMDALVAVGEFAATIFPGHSAHDSAAASLIVSEAGGVYTSMSGTEQRYDKPCDGHIAAANREIFVHIRALMP